MKLLIHILIVITSLSTSCNNQEKNNNIIINYSAQTRGFIYSIHLENNVLEINDNNKLKINELTENQKNKINNLLIDINFKEIENNISINDLAVDKAIKGIFKTTFQENSYTFEFNHNKLPKSIQKLLRQLEELSN
jgi:hypothetical protein